MSDYVSKKAIRYKFKEVNIEIYDKYEKYGNYSDNSLKKDYNLKNEMEVDYAINYQKDYESEMYLDIPLNKTYGTIAGDFGISRLINNEESEEYLEDFKKVIPTITKDDLRYVFYCYYNGVDAPSCYDVGEWNNN